MAHDFELRLNNARLLSICPGCRAPFKPELGVWPFAPDSAEPLCESCCSGGADLTSSADRVTLEAAEAQSGIFRFD